MASITQQKSGTYRITVSLGYDGCGRKIRQTCTFKPDESKCKSKTSAARAKELRKQVEEYAAEFEKKCQNGERFEAETLKFRDFVERWFSEYTTTQQETTLASYRDSLEIILPKLGNKTLAELTPASVQSFYNWLMSDKARRDGHLGGYSYGTRQKIARTLSVVMSAAERLEIISRNPCSKCSVPKAKQPEGKRENFLTASQAASLLEFTEQPYTVSRTAYCREYANGKHDISSANSYEKTMSLQNRTLIHFALVSGCRKGEICGLMWSDIDFDAGTVTISRSIGIVDGGKEIVKIPKTQTSHRTISISSGMLDMLKQHRREQAQYRLSVGDFWVDGGWVFCRKDGSRISYSDPYRTLENVIQRYNATHKEPLPMVSFHGLRHSAATALVASGTDIKTVSSRLGHANVTITLDTYTHFSKENDKDAAERLEQLFTKQA